MILFPEDWHKPENRGPDGIGPIIDTRTTNTSFLNYASLLQQMGIKNWAWPLALHDPKLQGVNPFDPDLSTELKIRVGLEISSNPWYYLREAALVPPTSGIDPVKFRATRANIGMFWLFMNNVSFYLLQPRQTGKSVVADAIKNYLMHYRLNNSRIILVTLSQKLLIENIERIKAMRDLLPKYTIAVTKKDSIAKEKYTYPARNNSVVVAVSQNSPNGANNVVRGFTVPIIQYDEAAMVSYMDILWPAAMATGTAARDEARRKGQPYGTIITTTAGDTTSSSGKYMYDIYNGCASWTENYFDCDNREHLHTVIAKASQDGDIMVGATFNHLQLGYTDEWLHQKIRDLKTNDKDKIDRDYFNRWTAGGMLSPLPTDVLRDIQLSERSPLHLEITDEGYSIKWYIQKEHIAEYMANNHCIIGGDSSEGVGRDATAFQVINISTLETVASISINEVDIIALARYMVKFMVKYRRTTLNIEHKSTGGTFIETLYTELPLYDEDPFKRIFNTIIQEPEKYSEQYKVLMGGRSRRSPDFYTQNKKRFGFTTTGKLRTLLYKEVLQVAAKRARHHIYDMVLSGELRRLEVDTATGRIDHTHDGHDDNVMAWMLAMYVLMFGRNLKWYGIDRHAVMSHIQEDGQLGLDLKSQERRLVETYKKEMEQCIETLASTDNPMHRKSLEHRIRMCNDRLRHFGEEPKNIDALLLDIQQKRREKLLQQM